MVGVRSARKIRQHEAGGLGIGDECRYQAGAKTCDDGRRAMMPGNGDTIFILFL